MKVWNQLNQKLISTEEFGRPDAFRWSRDSTKIAFWHTDQTEVKSFLLYDDTTEKYPVATELKYPKAGHKNSVVKIGVADVVSGEIVWIDIGEEVRRPVTNSHILRKIFTFLVSTGLPSLTSWQSKDLIANKTTSNFSSLMSLMEPLRLF